MIKLLLQKGVSGLLTLLGVTVVVFFLFNVLGDPAQMMVDQNASQAQIEKIQQKYGFDLPTYQQFLYFLNDLSPLSIPRANHFIPAFLTNSSTSGLLTVSILL